ncbi:acyl-CoA dehydrogenase domain-containing protein [Pseudomonas sp. M47T1]|uniref:acyl-CoA dehydrogenase family protein n=1 Tax=Pseudomonas sp. M47T1 TaxID=1179778 RepID=UPI00026078BD|nr:acyl-CoA dehydrogenase family protein [Pseudomonas sp. M47T1]EIK95806.1 acyl-CoA dehydrogenase domain-containing protein [Pseudomonas sp. M47T1]
MDLRPDPADDLFRQQVRQFLREQLPPDMAERNRLGYHFLREDMRHWTRLLHAQGWAGANWPKAWGGTGWSQLQQFIFEEECALAGAPPVDVAGLRMFGPVVMTFGNEQCKARFGLPILTGELFWAQGFSEPNAGSDLGSLATRAVRDGNEYVINGRKIWTSYAHNTEVICVLARTDLTAKRSFSMIVVDAHAPGVSIRPIIDIGEGYSLNETLFEDVRVPLDNLIGEEGQGWNYAKFLLDNERASSAEVPLNKSNLMKLRRMLALPRADGSRRLDDPGVASRLAQLEVHFQALEMMTLRALTEKDQGSRLPVGSLLKLRGSELLQKIGEMQVEALGDYGAYVYADPHESAVPWPPGPAHAPGVVADFMYRRATTIYGGANEVQRTIIARSFLEL